MEAEAEFDADLPDGLDTEHSFVMNIEDGNEKRVGWMSHLKLLTFSLNISKSTSHIPPLTIILDSVAKINRVL